MPSAYCAGNGRDLARKMAGLCIAERKRTASYGPDRSDPVQPLKKNIPNQSVLCKGPDRLRDVKLNFFHNRCSFCDIRITIDV